MARVGPVHPDFPHVLCITGSDIYPRPSLRVHQRYLTRDVRSESDQARITRAWQELWGYQSRLLGLLNRPVASFPVCFGSHDFWITYWVGLPKPSDWPSDGPAYVRPDLGGGLLSHEDPSARPRRLRGIVRAGEVPGPWRPSSDEAEITQQMSLLLEEVGHHWCVPRDLTFLVPGKRDPVAMPTSVELTRRINARGEENTGDGGWAEPALLGRNQVHWSSYFNGHASPLEGVNWVDGGSEGGHRKWQAEPLSSPPTVQPPGLPRLALPEVFNDLELFCMGLKDGSEAYAGNANRFEWMEPLLVAPGTYFVGVAVLTGDKQGYRFGFEGDYRKLVVRDLRGAAPLASVDLGPGYRALDSPLNGVALRIARRGDDYYFQARYQRLFDTRDGRPPRGCLDLPTRLFRLGRRRTLWHDLRELRPPDPNATFERYRTIAIQNDPNDAQALALVVSRWGSPAFLVEGAFRHPELKTPGASYVMRTGERLPRWVMRGSYDGLQLGALHQHLPEAGPSFSRGDRLKRLRIRVPFAGTSDNAIVEMPDFSFTDTVDKAPKAITRAPQGDFSFATWARVNQTMLSPWTGGGVTGRTMWGRVHSMEAKYARLPPTWSQWGSNFEGKGALPGRLDPPGGIGRHVYKMAFIIVANDPSHITAEMIEKVDVLRRYFEEAFPAALPRQASGPPVRSASTALDWPELI